MEDSRGFHKFIGKKIVSVDYSAVNVVHFTLDSGEEISIDTDGDVCGIPILMADTQY